jgi:glycosyltransferase involved in cell wall biosynthesis
MKLLWFTWKDRKNPSAGGAEVINEELAKRLVQNGHEVNFLVSGFAGGSDEEIIDGYRIIRLGDRYNIYWKAYRYYKKNLEGWADMVIEEINTFPFFTSFYIKKTPSIYLFYQLCREIWFYQMSLPFNLMGYLLEPLYLRCLARDRRPVLTESESAREDLTVYGFEKNMIKIFPVGMEMKPAEDIEKMVKYKEPTMLSLGSIRGMKRTADQIKAFELAKNAIPELKMKIAGDANNSYGRRILKMIEMSPYREDIQYLGRVNNEKKIELMQKSHVITVTSVKEGWGLVVTEANSQGTPAIVYNVDGLRDSVKNNVTGLICKDNTPEELARNVIDLVKDQGKYNFLRENAWQLSKEFSFERSYQEFIRVINSI